MYGVMAIIFFPNIFYGPKIFSAQIFFGQIFFSQIFFSQIFFSASFFFLKNLFFFEFTFSTVFACHNMFVKSGVWAKKVISIQNTSIEEVRYETLL